MSMADELRRALAALGRTQKSMDSLEKRVMLKPASCARGEINVEIRGDQVFIDAPRNTIIHCSCWADDITKMEETITMGSEEHEYLIKEIMELGERITEMEKRL